MTASTSSIRQAVQAAGGQTALAQRIGARQQEIWNWLNGRQVPDHRCPAIERESGVPVEQLRSDLRWVRVPDPNWPHPKGRPCIDVIGPTEERHAA
ncbi:MAG: hypothetical protein EOP35_05150 [Rubrivivax sp.]|nr:MAG: hypothetical protein EOP35_05150 [Rubrivivax sp.]